METSTRLLVADDDRAYRTIINIQLSQRGFDVLEASDGDGALRIAERDRPAAALLDIRMPGLSGLAVLPEIKQLMPIPVFIMSARVSAADRSLALELGAEEVFVKPMHPDELAARIRAAL